jgi:micrococcal nuclease
MIHLMRDMQNRCVAILLALAGCAPSGLPGQQISHCVVGRIVDGDTFRCRDGRRVRLIGIDSPEQGQRPYAAKARAALLRMAPPGTALRLEGDVSTGDRYGRLLAYAWVDSQLVNEALILEGWAVQYTVPPNVKYADRLGRAQKEARALGRGLWSERTFECLPADYRRRKCVNPP